MNYLTGHPARRRAVRLSTGRLALGGLRVALCLLVGPWLVACGGSPPTPQAPAAYLDGALSWIEENAMLSDRLDWTVVRTEALALAPGPKTTADTYPAIRHVLQRLGEHGDLNAWLSELPPGEQVEEPGFDALVPGVIFNVAPGSPADRAGLKVGDVIETINGQAPRAWNGTPFVHKLDIKTFQLRIRQAGQVHTRDVTLEPARFSFEGMPVGRRIVAGKGTAGYLELPYDWGSQKYPTRAQQAMRAADQPEACGWIVDLRRNNGGDLWSYLAAIGPLLGEGEVGGFIYRDGRKEPRSYRAGKVVWGNEERAESYVDGAIYQPKRPQPPVALLVSRATFAAGELTHIAFQGRSGPVRSFGDVTGGMPTLLRHTSLSDGAEMYVSGAFGMDRTGRVYSEPIAPDQVVATDWTRFGADTDAVVLAAQDWLAQQPACAGS